MKPLPSLKNRERERDIRPFCVRDHREGIITLRFDLMFVYFYWILLVCVSGTCFLLVKCGAVCGLQLVRSILKLRMTHRNSQTLQFSYCIGEFNSFVAHVSFLTSVSI